MKNRGEIQQQQKDLLPDDEDLNSTKIDPPDSVQPVELVNEIDGTVDDDENDNINATVDEGSAKNAVPVDPLSCCVQVAVRVRPILALEGDDECCIQVLRTSNHNNSQSQHNNYNTIQIGGSNGPQYTFDQVFDMNTTQVQIYESRVAPLITSCLDGYNATILAYGQTGSGKTHTIMGPNPTITDLEDDVDAGVIPRAMTAIFSSLREKKKATRSTNDDADLDYQVSIQFIELYGEEIRDLLVTNTVQRTQDKLTIRDYGTTGDEPEVVGATQTQVTTASQALDCLAHGMLRRVTGATAMNESSSRSHAILSVCIEQTILYKAKPDPGSTALHSTTTEEHVQVVRSKFNFVDLAGAERQKRTGASGKRLKEGIDINKGLSNLGNVISALGDPKKRGRAHVPYRDAKLTRLLKGSLGGNHKTLMIACVSPAAVNMGESMNCLRYANRAKNIQNKAIVNVDASTRLVQDLQAQIVVLATDLLHALDGKADRIQMSKENVVTLANGGTLGSTIKTIPDVSNAKNTVYPNVVDTRLKDTAEELYKTQRALEQIQTYHDEAELELHTVRAQNSVLDAKFSILIESNGSGSNQQEEIEKAFTERAVQYEAEIARLRKALHQAVLAKSELVSWSDSPNNDIPVDDFDDNSALLAEEEHILESDRKTLLQLRAGTDELNASKENDSTKRSQLSNEENVFDEENFDKDNIDVLTKKYLVQLDDENDGTFESLHDKNEASERLNQFSSDIEDLARSIETKERLIQQIKRNKEREALMRKFFEEKLAELQSSLVEKEKERDHLRHELEVAEQRNTVSPEMVELLQQKQDQIDALNKLRVKYEQQTKSSSQRGDSDKLIRLQQDVVSMKKRKADMQKEMASEKRHHLKELRKLNKIVSQKDREIIKIQKTSTQQAIEIEKTTAISKKRLDELSQLKKALRSYKRGIGLDPVMVGRRQTRQKARNNNEMITEEVAPDADNNHFYIADIIRDYFDSKVASIVRKEALVDQLAREWEEYFALITRRQLENEVENSATESLDMQIQFKNDNIRKVAKRLQRQKIPISRMDDEQIRGEKYIFDDEFVKLGNGVSKTVAACVLFGMVVRERRRVASLAKVASLLDEKIQVTQKELTVSEAALRSFQEEHRQDVVDLELSQHDKILCLIDMVQDEQDQNEANSSIENCSTAKLQKKLLVLANERVLSLERQLSDQKSNKVSISDYESQIETLNNLATSLSKECEQLKRSENDLRTALRQVRDVAANNEVPGIGANVGQSIVEVVDSALHHPTKKMKKKVLSPRLKKHIELMHSSDSDYSDDDTAFASSGDILSTNLMADISMIAKGKIPPSLRSPEILEEASKLDCEIRTSLLETNSQTMDNSKAIDQLMSTGQELEEVGNIESSADGVRQVYQSVFDRLGSPSQYTGTQKEKYHETRTKRDRSPERIVALDKEPRCNITNEVNVPSDTRFSVNIDREDYIKQNVFDRLQKTTTHAAAIRQNETLHIESRSIFDGKYHDDTKRSPVEDSSNDVKAFSESRSTVDRAAYAKQNVFDRLQKTTTLAAAVRQSETLQLESRINSDTKPLISPVSHDSDTQVKRSNGKQHTPQDNTENKRSNGKYQTSQENTENKNLSVFERLNKTTTRAYAKKTNK